MSKMMRKIWHQGSEASLRAQIQLVEAKRRVRNRLGKGQGGATMVEYAILVALISVAAIVVILALGTKIENVFNQVYNKMGGA